jgi:hypothetical protein
MDWLQRPGGRHTEAGLHPGRSAGGHLSGRLNGRSRGELGRRRHDRVWHRYAERTVASAGGRRCTRLHQFGDGGNEPRVARHPPGLVFLGLASLGVVQRRQREVAA